MHFKSRFKSSSLAWKEFCTPEKAEPNVLQCEVQICVQTDRQTDRQMERIGNKRFVTQEGKKHISLKKQSMGTVGRVVPRIEENRVPARVPGSGNTRPVPFHQYGTGYVFGCDTLHPQRRVYPFPAPPFGGAVPPKSTSPGYPVPTVPGSNFEPGAQLTVSGGRSSTTNASRCQAGESTGAVQTAIGFNVRLGGLVCGQKCHRPYTQGHRCY